MSFLLGVPYLVEWLEVCAFFGHVDAKTWYVSPALPAGCFAGRSDLVGDTVTEGA
jgi:hypothetical protein